MTRDELIGVIARAMYVAPGIHSIFFPLVGSLPMKESRAALAAIEASGCKIIYPPKPIDYGDPALTAGVTMGAGHGHAMDNIPSDANAVMTELGLKND